VALIGYGLAGEVFHAPLIAAVPGLELAAIVTRDDERRARADRLEVAVVATPNRTHVELARAAISSGLNVVVDKPLAASAEAAREVVELARTNGPMLAVSQTRRWDGDFLTTKRLLESGELGRVHRYESRYERWRPQLRGGWRESGEAAEAGGLLYDLGSHLVDQALLLFGPAREVYAELDVRRQGAQVDDDVFVAITHASGVRSHLWASVLSALHGPRLRVLGERAAYVKYGLDVQEEQLISGLGPASPGWGEEPEERWGVLGAGDEVRRVPTARGAYERFYEGVAASLLHGAPPPVDTDEVVAALEVLDAARTSARERRVVKLTT
jgi:predicted dehydrogenase